MVAQEGLGEEGEPIEGDEVTVSQAAQLLQVPEDTIRHQIRAGSLPAHKILTDHGEVDVIPRFAVVAAHRAATKNRQPAGELVVEFTRRAREALVSESLDEPGLQHFEAFVRGLVAPLAERLQETQIRLGQLIAAREHEVQKRLAAEQLVEQLQDRLIATQDQLALLSRERIAARQAQETARQVSFQRGPLFAEKLYRVEAYSSDPSDEYVGAGAWKEVKVVVNSSSLYLETEKGVELRLPIADISGIEPVDDQAGWVHRKTSYRITVTQAMKRSISYVALDSEQRDRLYRCLTALVTE